MPELFLFLLGLAVGSFLNVLIDRLPHDESPFKGRSYCDHCKKTLKWYDLIPIVSFLLLKGKCRYCRSHISVYYPTVELITGFLFVSVLFFLGGFTINVITIITIIYYLFIVSSLVVIFFTDLKYGIIPDKIVYPAVLISLIYLFMIHPSADGLFMIHLLSGLGAFLFFLLLFLVTRGRGMGFGDVKLVFLLGLFLGYPYIIVAFYIAFLTGAFFGCIMVLWGKKRFHGGTLAFGPFLVLGTFAAIFFGESIVQQVIPFLMQR